MGTVVPLGDPQVHFWLTRSVARAVGVSLSEAMAENALSAQGYAEMITRCRTCPFVDQCQHWLGTPSARQEGAPEFCMHKSLFDGLRNSH